jgi:hypothetical protein
MRPPTLAASITVMGAIGTLVKPSDDFQLKVVFGVLLLMVVFIGIRMLGVLNRTIYIFNEHVRSIEERLAVVGFASVWTEVARATHEHGGSYVFAMSSRLMNVGSVAYVIWLGWPNAIVDWHRGSFLVGCIAVLCINEVHIRRHVAISAATIKGLQTLMGTARASATKSGAVSAC